MLQCLPVKKNIVRIAHLSFLIALITCCPGAVKAQSNVGQNTIVDVKEDRSRGSAVITTAVKQPLPRPIIQFLQGESGNTVLVADFNNVVYPGSTKVINVHNVPEGTTGSGDHSGIKLVRIGRFQENPPVFRIAIVSSDADKLKSVNFVSGPGSLVVKWPKSRAPVSALASDKMPAPAPEYGRRRAYQTNYSQPAGSTAANIPGRAEIPRVVQAQNVPEVAPSGRLSLRPAMPEPTIESQEQHGLKIIRDQTVELTAKPASLNATTPGGSKPIQIQAVAQVRSQTASDKSPEVAQNISKTQETKTVLKTSDSAPPKAPLRVLPGKSIPVVAGAKPNQFNPRSSETEIALAGTPANIEQVSQKDQSTQPADELSKKAEESQSPEVEDKPAPTVALTPNAKKGYTIKIVSPDKSDLNFTSFRLHNPERFVIDLQDQRALSGAVVPQPENLDHLKAIRVGAPDPLKNTGRLVLDLAGENVSVIPGDAGSVNEVSFVIGEAADPVAGLTAPPGSVLVLDAGHGGSDPGAQRGFVKEKELTLAIAQKTRAKLAASGIKVIMTRSDDTFVSLQDRVSITNTTKPDMFLSVHINSLESTKDIHGIETYYQTDMSRALAQTIHESLVSELDAPNRNIRKAKFYVVNRAEVPAVLAEVGFISNKGERDKLVSEDYQEKIAGALTKGAILYLKQHSAVAAGRVNRASDSPSDNNGPVEGEVGSTIPRAKSLVHKGLGIKSN
jgi:N-acetylmuramoyl-L-alanine amidase CwlD